MTTALLRTESWNYIYFSMSWIFKFVLLSDTDPRELSSPSEFIIGRTKRLFIFQHLRIQENLHPDKIKLLIELSVPAHPTIGQLVQRIF